MAGLLDFLQSAGLLGGGAPGMYNGPGSMNFGAGDPSQQPQIPPFMQAMAQAQPQQMAQAQQAPQSPIQLPQAGQPSPQGLPQQGQYAQQDPRLQGGPSFSDRLLMLGRPDLYDMLSKQQAQGAFMKAYMAQGHSYPEAVVAASNQKVQEYLFGAPVNNGTAKFANGTELPVISSPGAVGQTVMPRDPRLDAMLGAPAKLGETTRKVGDLSTTAPTLYGANGQVTTPMPPSLGGQGGMQGEIDLNNKLKQSGAAATKMGDAQGTAAAALPQTLATMDQALKNLDVVQKSPNISNIVGIIAGRLPAIGGEQADLVNRVTQLQSEAMLQGIQSLRGIGRITQAEAFKAGDAVARLSRIGSVDGFKSALGDLKEVLTLARTRAGTMAGGEPTPPEQGQTQAPSFTEGATATNPKTGQKIILKGGQWQPVQ
jgi:hypothetical protein